MEITYSSCLLLRIFLPSWALCTYHLGPFYSHFLFKVVDWYFSYASLFGLMYFESLVVLCPMN